MTHGAPGGVLAFHYHRSLSPMLWVLIALSCCEIAVVHLMVALLWSETLAAVLSVLTLLGIIWLAMVLRSFRRLPVLLGEQNLVWRAGSLKQVEVPLAAVAGLRKDWDGAAVKRRDVLNAALIAYPNVVVDLAAPVSIGRGRQVTALAHRLDEPIGFTQALAGRIV